MSFQPALPLGGVAGWGFLQRTKARQEAAFAASPVRQTEIDRFSARFEKINSAKDLVKDRATLRVVLGAFGLQDDLQNRAFIERVISEGVADRRALANRLADKRYAALATGLEHLGPNGSGKPDRALTKRIGADYLARSFEVAVGEQSQTFRLALAAERDFPAVLSNFVSDRARWFGILGNPPLRNVLETALGLPKEFANLNIEQQAERIKTATRQRFGAQSVEALVQPETLQRVIQRFLVMAELRETNNSFSTAWTLLENARIR
jgi:hypothetical protein